MLVFFSSLSRGHIPELAPCPREKDSEDSQRHGWLLHHENASPLVHLIGAILSSSQFKNSSNINAQNTRSSDFPNNAPIAKAISIPGETINQD
jgi:hypothetical protein